VRQKYNFLFKTAKKSYESDGSDGSNGNNGRLSQKLGTLRESWRV